MSGALKILLFALLNGILVATCHSQAFHTVNGTVNKKESFNVSVAKPKAHVFQVNRSSLDETTNAWVETSVQEDVWDGEAYCPLIFTLRQQRSSRSWALPVDVLSDGKRPTLRTSTGFTVCLDENVLNSSPRDQIEYLVLVSTCSEEVVEYTLEFKVAQDGFILEMEPSSMSTVVSPSLQRFFRFNFPDESEMDEVIVQVTAEDNVCMTVAVQTPSCKILNEDVIFTTFTSLWQDMTKVAVIPVKKEDFPNGFFVGLQVHENNNRCTSYKGVANDAWKPIGFSRDDINMKALRQKNITITIIPDVSLDRNKLPVFVPLLIVAGVFCFTLVVYSIFACAPTCKSRRWKKAEDQRQLVLNDELSEQIYDSSPHRERTPSETSADFTGAASASVVMTPPGANGLPRTGEYSFTCNGWLTIESFMNKQKKLKKSLRKIHLLIFSVGIFYVLPTIQLVFTYHQISDSTGQTDLCYRNYLCSDKVLGLDDFNHIYSNSVYVFLGLIFCCFVMHYHDTVNRFEAWKASTDSVTGAHDPTAQVLSGHGVLHQFGVFYGLGLSLSLEGILSAAYHVCPTQMNFQFDTSFMYILAALCTIRVYQFRHPDPICPHNTFGFLAFISTVSVGGLLLGSHLYESAFMVLQIILSLLISIYLYYVGYILDEEGFAVTSYSIYKKSKFWSNLRNEPWTLFHPRFKSRLLFIIPFIAYNIGLCSWQWIFQFPREFPTYLVLTFAGNMMLYFLHYFAMKIYHEELFHRLAIQPLIYLFLSGVFAVLALLYFGDIRYDSNLSPAESRELNRPCMVAEFYDTHDMWHFMSAVSIFFFFMALLTVDDAILNRPRSEIIVF